MFLQIHYLTSYHATLLNRDDAGLAKRIVFGGVPRLRVSSQCLKRHWRQWLQTQTQLASAFRTRSFFGRVVKRRLVDAGVPETLAHELVLQLAAEILQQGKAGKDVVDKETLDTAQPLLFGQPEADFFVSLLQEAAQKGDASQAADYLKNRIKEGKQNFQALVKQAGIDDPMVGFEGALFGRFITSDILARVDAPVHVAHAFTTHALDTEVDFFTVVDDLAAEEETGAAHAGDMELGAGIFYGYVVVDVPLLVSNLTGCDRQEWESQDHHDTKSLLRALIQAVTQVSPGAKLGATAPYARAEWVLLESGKEQPRSLANAFLEPVRIGTGQAHPMAQSVVAMASYMDALEKMYGEDGVQRQVSSIHPWPRAKEQPMPLPQAVESALAHTFGGSS